ncbi:MAG: hypothetical protein PHX62_07860 [Bacilli bacterium]|nr:hypothetical protein [Bacilli bacterium]
MKLLVVIVDRELTDKFTSLLNNHSDKFQVVMYGHGTANSEILHYFGLAEKDKSIIFCVVDEEEVSTVFADLDAEKAIHKDGGAVAFSISIANINKKFFDLIKSLLVNHKEDKDE